MNQVLKLALLGVVFSFASVAIAQEAAPPSEITFRRVTPPAPGETGPRINIQISAEEHAFNTNPPPGAEAASPVEVAFETPDGGQDSMSNGRTGWFWSVISPSLPADPNRFWEAQAHLQGASEAAALSVLRLETLHRMADTHGAAILTASIGNEVSPALILSVMAVESAGRAEAVSSAGAQGLMQLIPATAERFGVEDPFDTTQNIAGGVAYLSWLLDHFDGDPVLALAGYNAGEGAVREAGGVPNYAETRDYVPKVLATWLVARRLCISPPELISDGCVFQPMASN